MEIVITLLVLVTVMVAQVCGIAFLMARFYRVAPPGKVLVRAGHGGPKAIGGVGIIVIPGLHSLHVVHAELELLNCGKQEVLVQLRQTREDILRAFEAFGTTEPSELVPMLEETIRATADDDTVLAKRLAEVGYRRI